MEVKAGVLMSVFRQNAANDPDADWTRLDASLHASTFLAHRSDTAGLFCPLHRQLPQHLCKPRRTIMTTSSLGLVCSMLIACSSMNCSNILR